MRSLLDTSRALLDASRIFDEVIADYCGISAACGRFRADWLLAFMGIDGEGTSPDGGGSTILRRPPLSGASRAVLRQLVVAVAENLEGFDRRHAEEITGALGLI